MMGWPNQKRQHQITILTNRNCLLCGKTEEKMCYLSPMTFCNDCMEKELEKERTPEKLFDKHIDAHKKQLAEKNKE